jgi:hypothetical protein
MCQNACALVPFNLIRFMIKAKQRQLYIQTSRRNRRRLGTRVVGNLEETNVNASCFSFFYTDDFLVVETNLNPMQPSLG